MESNKDFIIENGVLVECLNKKATNLVIPNSVATIGEYAFAYCTSLESVTIPNSVAIIGRSAFFNCKSLTNITIPNSVTSIGRDAFVCCTALTSIIIPNGVTTIGGCAFYNCVSLESVIIPNSVTTIGKCAFAYCSSLKSVTNPNSVTTIGEEAFYKCTSLKSVTIPNSVTSIGNGVFRNCKLPFNEQPLEGVVKAYKAFRPNMTCRDYQFEEGKSFHQDGFITCCENGFHACQSIYDIFNYYYYGKYGKDFVIHEVECSGEFSQGNGDSKFACSDIKIGRRLTLQEIFQ